MTTARSKPEPEDVRAFEEAAKAVLPDHGGRELYVVRGLTLKERSYIMILLAELDPSESAGDWRG